MILLKPDQTATLKDWFRPERPGPLIGLHVIHTGNGACFVDRWPDPRAVLVETAGNYSLVGDAGALQPADVKQRIAGFVEAPEPFVPWLREAFGRVDAWERVVFDLKERPVLLPNDYLTRPLGPEDAYYLWGLSPESNWISKTWGGPTGLAVSGYAWGAFVAGRLASVACTFFLGEAFEELGVVTEPEFRGLGLSVACAGALCGDILNRGRRPSWTTSPDNVASVRVAEKLGFSLQRRDYLYVIGRPIPEPVVALRNNE
jgi:RimJ/RimL family protein N-acetyltransferase